MKNLEYKNFDEWWNSMTEETRQTWKDAMVNVHGLSVKEFARQMWVLGWIYSENTHD